MLYNIKKLYCCDIQITVIDHATCIYSSIINNKMGYASSVYVHLLRNMSSSQPCRVQYNPNMLNSLLIHSFTSVIQVFSELTIVRGCQWWPSVIDTYTCSVWHGFCTVMLLAKCSSIISPLVVLLCSGKDQVLIKRLLSNRLSCHRSVQRRTDAM